MNNCNKKIAKFFKYLTWMKFLNCTVLDVRVYLELAQLDDYKLMRGEVDRKELLFLKEYLNNSEQKVFFDLGANLGFYSLYLAKHVKNSAIYAFEPFEYTINKFKHNISLNNLDNISILPYAIADNEKPQKMRVQPGHSGSNSLSFPKEMYKDNSFEIEIQCRKLINVIKDLGISSIDCMKLDIEGHELIVAKDFFIEENRQFFPKALVIEEWGHVVKVNKESSIEVLLSAGYKLVDHGHNNFFFVLKDN